VRAWDRFFSNFTKVAHIAHDAAGEERWLGKSAQAGKWSFCLKAASMAAEQEIR
jgi:hypothetical protein